MEGANMRVAQAKRRRRGIFVVTRKR